ncbi:DNA-binding FadR family transcriptional regulator [Paraburkholderia sp. Clong3]
MEHANKDRSLVSKVMDGLVSGIVEEKYGAILPPQDVLSKEFDVSRTVMREALSMLLARDMLDVRPKIGTRIRPDERLAHDRRGRRQLAFPREARSDVSA